MVGENPDAQDEQAEEEEEDNEEEDDAGGEDAADANNGAQGNGCWPILTLPSQPWVLMTMSPFPAFLEEKNWEF